MGKRYLKRGLFIIIVFLVIIVIMTASPRDSDNYKKENIVLLSLDDRPANQFVPENIARIAGASVTSLPGELMEKILPRDESFDPLLVEEMGRFLLNRKGVREEKADAFVISADMLFFGGLVSSRRVASDVNVEERIEQGVSILKNLNEKYPDTPVYVYSSIQRLAPTLAGDVSEDEYDDLRRWAINYDRVHNEGMKEYGSSLDRLKKRIPEDIMKGYLNSREMNQRVNLKLLELLADHHIDYMVIAQDDAASYGLHRKEKEELMLEIDSLDVGNRVEIFPGIDEVDGILISRHINKTYDREPAFYPVYPEAPEVVVNSLEVEYYDPRVWVPPLEDISFVDNLEAHVNALGGGLVDERDEADILLFINNLNCSCGTKSEDFVEIIGETGEIEIDEDKKARIKGEVIASLGEFVDEIALSVDRGYYTAISDVGKLNGACEKFVEILLDKVEPFELLSYSGWNTAGNSVGQSLSQANSRHFYLQNDRGGLTGIRAQAALMFHRFSKDHVYANFVRREIEDYLEDMQGEGHNLGDDYEKTVEYLNDRFDYRLNELYREHFSGQKLAGVESNYYVVRGLSGLEIDLPWQRLFEVYIRAEFTLERNQGTQVSD